MGKKNAGSAKKTYLVIGLGRFGMALCDSLAGGGATVIAVDNDLAKVEAAADRVEYSVRLDATQEAPLERAGAKDADVAIVCLGDKDQATIMTSAILLDLGVPTVIACSSDPVLTRILKKIGVHKVISPQEAMGRRFAELLLRPWLNIFEEIGDDVHAVGRVKAPAPITGKPLSELALPLKYGLNIVSIIRDGRRMLPSGNVVLDPNDDLLVFGEKAKMAALFDLADLRHVRNFEL